MVKSLVNLLINPNAFFKDVSAEKESLKIPGLIVLIFGIISAVYAYLIGGLTGKMMGSLIPGISEIVLFSSAFIALISVFIIWIIVTSIFFIFSLIIRKELRIELNPEFLGLLLGFIGITFFLVTGVIFKSELQYSLIVSILRIALIIAITALAFLLTTRFKRSLEFVGYGYLPQIFGAVLNVIVAVQYIPRIIVPHIPSSAAQDPQGIIDATNTLMHDPAMREMIQITSLISIVFMLWSATIWIASMRNARQLSERDSALCVGIPVIIYILYIIYSMTGI